MFRKFVNAIKTALAALVVFTLLPTLFPNVPRAAVPVAVAGLAESDSTNLEFEENRGQLPSPVRYFARGAGANIFLTPKEAVYVMRPDCGTTAAKCDDGTRFALRMKFDGANPDSGYSGEVGTGHSTNYLKGGSEDNITDIPTFSRVRMSGVYNGIDVVWHGLGNGSVRYDFVADPRADPSQIALVFDGADSVVLDGNGDLLIGTPAGTIRQGRPVTFQVADGLRNEVESSFRVDEGNVVRFQIGAYDPSLPLTIDPTVTLGNLAFSTFLGGIENERMNSLAIDENGHTFATGFTESPFFPTTAGTFDTTFNSNPDVFVTRFNTSGSGLVFSTFIGGSSADEGRGIEVDSAGNVYVTGSTSSPAFPTTPGAYDTAANGGTDVFALKLNSSGNALIYSTFVGSSSADEAYDLALDSSNNLYAVGRTAGAFPTTAGAFDSTPGGGNDAFLIKLDANGANLLYSTLLGSTLNDWGYAVDLDPSANAYISGFTSSTDFPTTAGAFDTTFNGVADGFVAKANTTASGSASLVYSTLVGGTDEDSFRSIAVDSAGNSYVTGSVINGGGFPTTAGAFDTTHNGSADVVVTKLNPSGSALVYSTYIGGTSSDLGGDILIDQSGNAIIGGSTLDAATDYPTVIGAFDTTHNGARDGFVTKLNANGSGLIYSTLIGGGADDYVTKVASDQAGNIYFGGYTLDAATDFPTTLQAFQPAHGGGEDTFVGKFGDFSIGGKVIDAATGNPLSNVMIALSGQVSGNVLTGTDGRFGFLDTVPGEPHAVSATRAGYAMNPAIFNIASLANNRELIFVATVGSPTGGSGGTLRFENVSYSKAENGGAVSVKIKRLGDIQTTDPVTVDLSTIAGSATQGQDFQPISGVVTFNALETEKTVTIPIVNDAALEPRESFSIAITNPTNNADIEPGRGSTTVQILDEDLSDGDLLISEFRQRGRLGPHDEFVKLFNPNDFDVTVQTSDGSAGLTLAAVTNGVPSSIVTIPNLITIGARGHYLLTNNDPDGGFSLIDYPTGRGTVTAVGDRTYSADIPDNSTLALLKTSDAASFVSANIIDAVGFDQTGWAEGKPLSPIVPQNSEMSFVRKLSAAGLTDSDSNRADFVMVDNHATVFGAADTSKVSAVLGAPAPESSESLRVLSPAKLSISDPGFETYDPAPVPNGKLGTLTVYRTLRNDSGSPIIALRLRAADFPTAGSQLSVRYSSRPDFRLLSSPDEGDSIRGVTLAAAALQPNGGGINSTLAVDSVTAANPLMPGQTIVVAIRFGVERWGRHPLVLAAEGSE